MKKISRAETIRITRGQPLYKLDYVENGSHIRKLGYNSGAYGWNYSVYYNELDDNYYIQGYRNFPKSTIYKHDK